MIQRRTAGSWQLVVGLLLMCGVAVVIGMISHRAAPINAYVEPRVPPALGDLYAPITVEVFSDFRCSYCRTFALDTLPQLAARYADSGKVYIQWRHMPILGDASWQAALAAECAHEQGVFWAYHDALFRTDDPLDAQVLSHAARGGAENQHAFDICIAQQTMAEVVNRDVQLARQYGLQGTPSFVINGEPFTGNRPWSWWQTELDALLATSAQ